MAVHSSGVGDARWPYIALVLAMPGGRTLLWCWLCQVAVHSSGAGDARWPYIALVLAMPGGHLIKQLDCAFFSAQ